MYELFTSGWCYTGNFRIAMKPLVALILMFILAEVIMIASPKLPEKSPEVTPAVKAETVKEDPRPNHDQAIDAVSRAHPHSLQVCYDTINNGFMIQYPVLPDDAPADNAMHGWWWIKAEHLWQAANGTWFTKLRDDSDYAQIYPEPFNLPCKKT